MEYELVQLGFFLLFYSLLGWAGETIAYAITRRKFANVGFLTLPLVLTYGITMVILVVILPSFGTNLVGQFVMTLMVSSVVGRLTNFTAHKLCPGVDWPARSQLFGDELRGILAALLMAGAYFLVYLFLHPLLLFLLPLIPALALRIGTTLLLALVLVDEIAVIASVRLGAHEKLLEHTRSERAANWLISRVWRRIHRAYPDVEKMDVDEELRTYTFGKGLSLDKLIWVFFLSALLGDLIETLYCRLVGGAWMSRSSVLYGPFSFVWGIGAVLLTVTLSPVAKKNDRWVFLGGFFIGGAYEYLCSVFTELVFGTVFWDYSEMPLNIGGRTNVLFMFFWGILSVVWVKMIYPRMSHAIEKLPPLGGTALTWLVTVAMLLNGALTIAAMLRYNIRQIDPAPYSRYDQLIDAQYPDSRIEERWPNMIVVDEK